MIRLTLFIATFGLISAMPTSSQVISGGRPAEQSTTELPTDELAGLLCAEENWYPIARQLARRARHAETEVVDALTDAVSKNRDSSSTSNARMQVVLGMLNRHRHLERRRTETRKSLESLRGAAKALSDVAAAKDAVSDTVRQAIRRVSEQIKSLEETVRELDERDPSSGNKYRVRRVKGGWVAERIGSKPRRSGRGGKPAKNVAPKQDKTPGGGIIRKQGPGGKKMAGDSVQGDARRINWIRPFSKASELARKSGRILYVKPIMGGSNTPAPDGVPCGGQNDCEGSW